MNTINSVEFLRLRHSVYEMVSRQLITQEEAHAFLAKTGYVIISTFEYHEPDGSVLTILDNKWFVAYETVFGLFV